MRALISVSDRSGAVDLARRLVDLDWEIISSGGTAAALRGGRVDVTEVAEVTGAPEMLGGRVKTIHPIVHGGILADRSKPEHLADLAAAGAQPIDLVVCNLYPFGKEPSIEMIDIGGPAMVRAAAKNHAHVGVVVDPADYGAVLEELEAGRALSESLRRRLARKAFAHCSDYDAAIVAWLDVTAAAGGVPGGVPGGAMTAAPTAAAGGVPGGAMTAAPTAAVSASTAAAIYVSPADAATGSVAAAAAVAGDPAAADLAEPGVADGSVVFGAAVPEELPPSLLLRLQRDEVLRYGENPHQMAARYHVAGAASWWDTAAQLGGKQLSYLNVYDTDAAWRLVHALGSDPAAVVVKHANPCGAAAHADIAEAYRRAHACDPVSAFGGVVALNRTVTAESASSLAEVFCEVVVAPGYNAGALEHLQAKPNLRILQATVPEAAGLHLRSLGGSFLVQTTGGGIEPAEGPAADPAEHPAGSPAGHSVADPADNPPAASSERPIAAPAYPTGIHDAIPVGWQVVTERTPSDGEWRDLVFAWRVVAAVSSNAIVVAMDRCAVGIGAGQQNRRDAGRIAAAKAGDRGRGGAYAGDAFFPFADGLDGALEAGCTAVAQPGGSVRDAEVIEAANHHGMAMVFTGRRAFRH